MPVPPHFGKRHIVFNKAQLIRSQKKELQGGKRHSVICPTKKGGTKVKDKEEREEKVRAERGRKVKVCAPVTLPSWKALQGKNFTEKVSRFCEER